MPVRRPVRNKPGPESSRGVDSSARRTAQGDRSPRRRRLSHPPRGQQPGRGHQPPRPGTAAPAWHVRSDLALGMCQPGPAVWLARAGRGSRGLGHVPNGHCAGRLIQSATPKHRTGSTEAIGHPGPKVPAPDGQRPWPPVRWLGNRGTDSGRHERRARGHEKPTPNLGQRAQEEAMAMFPTLPRAHRSDTGMPLDDRLPTGFSCQWQTTLTSASRACCCPAKPAVVVLMPPAPGRAHRTDLLLCRHHSRMSLQALTAAGAIILDPDDPAADSQAAHAAAQRS